MSEGVKHDAGKAPLHLLPPDALLAIAEVLRTGALKYGPRNWEEGMDWSRVYGAALRHMLAWWAGEDDDPETRLSHLAHAATNLMFLVAYEQRGAGKDDRP